MTVRRDNSLSRWSRRKVAARGKSRGGAAPKAITDPAEDDGRAKTEDELGETPETASSMPIATHAVTDADTTAEVDPDDVAALAEEHGLPDIDGLDRDSDYTQFMAKDVPAALTRAALRKLWRSDPLFANLDKLNDYDEDFRIAEGVVEAVRTSYQVGKGFLDQINDVADQEQADGEAVVADEAAGETVADAERPQIVDARTSDETSEGADGKNDPENAGTVGKFDGTS